MRQTCGKKGAVNWGWKGSSLAKLKLHMHKTLSSIPSYKTKRISKLEDGAKETVLGESQRGKDLKEV
jgi:hypothetical protein